MDNNEREHDRHQDPTRLERAKEKSRETLGKAKDGMAAGASGVAEFTRKAASKTAGGAGRAVEFVREAETDRELKGKVKESTETSIHRAGHRLSDSAPAIGRGAEVAVDALGGALHYAARPIAAIVGAIAGTVGGWWKKATSDSSSMFPEHEEQACRAHFATVITIEPEMTYDRARTGYELGYVASRNPDYQGRTFEEIEEDLRHGFTGEHADEYDSLRDFTRYGYGRGTGGTL
jgi:hypothetical protein